MNKRVLLSLQSFVLLSLKLWRQQKGYAFAHTKVILKFINLPNITVALHVQHLNEYFLVKDIMSHVSFIYKHILSQLISGYKIYVIDAF